MRYAVIGGAGFIGSYLTKELLKKGHTVVVIDNLHTGKIENLENLKNLEFYKIDIRNYEKLDKVLKNIDGIFHQAALTNVQESFEKTEKYYDVNVNGTDNIFKIANTQKIKVVFASSASVYGNIEKEDITEDSLTNPINPYGKTKMKCEKLAREYSKIGLSVIGLRYFNVFGIGQNLSYAGVISKNLVRLKKKIPPIIFGDGKQSRDFIYIDDIVDANIKAMLSNITSDFFNVGTSKSTSILELSNIMIKLSGNNCKPIFQKPLDGDIKKSAANIDKITEKLNWKSKITLDIGLKKIFAEK